MLRRYSAVQGRGGGTLGVSPFPLTTRSAPLYFNKSGGPVFLLLLRMADPLSPSQIGGASLADPLSPGIVS